MEQQTKVLIQIINQRIKDMNALYREAARISGISDGELSVWSILLHAQEPCSQYDLCEELSLPRQTVNSIVNGLIRKKFVVLEHVPGTRNRKSIHLTQEGLDFGREHVMWIFESEQRAMEASDPQEVQLAISMLERYTRCLRQEISGHGIECDKTTAP